VADVVAIIADIVGSRELADRDHAQQLLEAAFARSAAVAPLLEPFQATVGDEFQALAADPASALRAVLAARLAFPDGVDCRFGLGLGDSREVRGGAGGADSRAGTLRDGSAWWRARAAIEEAHRRMDGGRTTLRSWYHAADAADAATVNAYLVMRDHAITRMKQLDRALVRGQLAGETQSELARRHGISQSAVSQRLERSGGSSLLATVELLGGSH